MCSTLGEEFLAAVSTVVEPLLIYPERFPWVEKAAADRASHPKR